MPREPFVRRVVLRNYKSIKECDVSLGALTFLVGPNGSGKSNFLEALRFLSDSLQTSVQDAVEERGEVRNIFWRAQADSVRFSIELALNLPDGGDAAYDITIGDQAGLFVIEEEHCLISGHGGRQKAEFRVRQGQVYRESVNCTVPNPPRASEGQLYLTNVSGYPEFSGVYSLLRGMRFYNIDPEEIRREASSGKPARDLQRNGRGALFATHRAFHNDRAKTRMHEYLQAVLPTLAEVRVETSETSVGSRHGSYITHGQKNVLAGEPKSLKFLLWGHDTRLAFEAQNTSDGTLRAFGVLLALFQSFERPAKDPIPLVGIEEPESTLHPAAAGVLFDALHEASEFTQVLVTTHSADLLDRNDLDVNSLLIVEMVDGRTVIGPADEASRSIMRDRLSTAGEMMRQDQLRPGNQASGPVGADTR